eukprot:2931-Heterococcus_DN1.PRE.1
MLNGHTELQVLALCRASLMQCREEERVQAALICRERYLFMSKRLGCEVSAYCSTYTVKQYILAYIGFDVRLVSNVCHLTVVQCESDPVTRVS